MISSELMLLGVTRKSACALLRAQRVQTRATTDKKSVSRAAHEEARARKPGPRSECGAPRCVMSGQRPHHTCMIRTLHPTGSRITCNRPRPLQVGVACARLSETSPAEDQTPDNLRTCFVTVSGSLSREQPPNALATQQLYTSLVVWSKSSVLGSQAPFSDQSKIRSKACPEELRTAAKRLRQ